LAENRAVSGGWVGGKFLAKETKGLTARQRTKKVEESGGKTHTPKIAEHLIYKK
jgi:hypothetical protein